MIKSQFLFIYFIYKKGPKICHAKKLETLKETQLGSVKNQVKP
jgi:hypothetical protein